MRPEGLSEIAVCFTIGSMMRTGDGFVMIVIMDGDVVYVAANLFRNMQYFEESENVSSARQMVISVSLWVKEF